MKYVFELNNTRTAAYDEDKLVGVCEFKVDGMNWIANHTETDSAYGGRGIAKELVRLLVESAKKEGAKIVPVCPYVVNQFEKNEEYREVQA